MTKRLLSGIQPTGKMHLGNYFGAVKSWVEQQRQFDAFFMIADYHSLTSLYESPKELRTIKHNLALDLLALGIDPQSSTLFFQSDVPEHTELHLILSMITPLHWLQRVPSYKSKIEEIQDKDLDTYGFLGYPVLQAADILLYGANVVPVGKDQLPHLELTREIARRFNHLYGSVFLEPADMLTQFPVLPGLDGRKMSKSYGNTLPISAPAAEIQALIMKMFTDPTRIRRTDPGHPEHCPVYTYHGIFNTPARLSEISQDCKSAVLGCVDCKRECGSQVSSYFEPFREKREKFESQPDLLADMMAVGAKKASLVAKQTIAQVKEVIGL